MSSCTHCVRATIEAFFFCFGMLLFRISWLPDALASRFFFSDFSASGCFGLKILLFRISLLPDALASRFFFSDFLASGCFLPQDFFFSDFFASECFGLRVSSFRISLHRKALASGFPLFVFAAEFRGRLFAALLIYEKEKLIADL